MGLFNSIALYQIIILIIVVYLILKRFNLSKNVSKKDQDELDKLRKKRENREL